MILNICFFAEILWCERFLLVVNSIHKVCDNHKHFVTSITWFLGLNFWLRNLLGGYCRLYDALFDYSICLVSLVAISHGLILWWPSILVALLCHLPFLLLNIFEFFGFWGVCFSLFFEFLNPLLHRLFLFLLHLFAFLEHLLALLVLLFLLLDGLSLLSSRCFAFDCGALIVGVISFVFWLIYSRSVLILGLMPELGV